MMTPDVHGSLFLPGRPSLVLHPNERLLTHFYEAFQKRDGAAMAHCYDVDASFRDPVFPDLRGDEPGRMWQMLCAGAKDLQVTFRDVHADDTTGSVHWEASYTFGKTGRPVHNVIEAHFEFVEGRISRHIDSFDFWRWSRQALGPAGVLLGWSPLVRNKVRRDAAARLERFIAADRKSN